MFSPAASFHDKFLQTFIFLHWCPYTCHFQSPLNDFLFELIHESPVPLFLFKLVHLLSESSFIKVLQKDRNEEIHYYFLSDQYQKHNVYRWRVRIHWAIKIIVNFLCSIIGQDNKHSRKSVDKCVKIHFRWDPALKIHIISHRIKLYFIGKEFHSKKS